MFAVVLFTLRTGYSDRTCSWNSTGGSDEIRRIVGKRTWQMTSISGFCPYTTRGEFGNGAVISTAWTIFVSYRIAYLYMEYYDIVSDALILPYC